MNTSERLIDWFLNSKIFNGEAYLEYYSPTKAGPAYPEITAYAISLSCILYRRKKDHRFLKRAETCANFMKKTSKDGGVPCLRDNLLYSFDTGVYVSSLFDLYSLTRKESYLREAERSLEWIYSLWGKEPFAAVDRLPVNKDWYHVSSVHLAKTAIGLLKASKYLEEKRHLDTAFELLSEFSHLQEADGSFRINENSTAVMVHPHCYATEGFLYAHHVCKRQEFLDAAKKSSDWLCKVQNADGSFYRWYNKKTETERGSKEEKIKATDATAQATRIWKLLGVNQKGIEKAYEYLESRLKGNGLRLYTIASEREYIYSWPTFFYIHSLILPSDQIEYSDEIF